MAKTLQTLRLRLDPRIPLPPVIDIWLDAERNVWCVGPPPAATSSALLMQQVEADRFFQEASRG